MYKKKTNIFVINTLAFGEIRHPSPESNTLFVRKSLVLVLSDKISLTILSLFYIN